VIILHWLSGPKNPRPLGQLHGHNAETPYLLGKHFYQQAYPHIAEELWRWDVENRQGPWVDRSREDLVELYLQQRRYAEAEELALPFRSSEDKGPRRLFFRSLYWQRKNQEAIAELSKWGSFDFTAWETMENLLFEGVVKIRAAEVAGLSTGDSPLPAEGAQALWQLYSRYWETNLHDRGASFFAEDPARYEFFGPDQALWIQAKSAWVRGEKEEAWDLVTDLAGVNPPWFTQGMVLAEWSYWTREQGETRSGISWLEDIWDTGYRRSYGYGRMQARSRNHPQAVQAYLKSLAFTQDPGLRDSSLLYLLESAREMSWDRLISLLGEYSPSNPNRFDDFWDEIRVELVSDRSWATLKRLGPFLKVWASSWVQAEWAFWQQYWPESTDLSPLEDYSNPYNIAVAVGDLSAPVLNLPEEGVSHFQEEWRPQSALEEELAAYLRYGFWTRAFRILKDQKEAFGLSLRWTLIRSFEEHQQNHYAISLWQDLWDEGYRSAEVFRGLFPLAFQEEITAAAQEAGLPVSLLYGLVREESRFNPKAGSHAGAQGLSQLMPATAADVARRIKLQDYDVHVPQDNLKIGAWYLAHRLDQFGNGAKALMAYNAGSGRVRRWEREWAALTPRQYLLAVPIKETRRYVQKVLVSALWYSKLYGFEDPGSIIRTVF
jgi:soluble lytic murein transglycosylase